MGKLLLLVFLLFCLPGFAQADFVADIVDLQKSGTPTLAHLYYTKSKFRIEILTPGENSLVLRLAEPFNGRKGAEIRLGGAGRSIVVDVAARKSAILDSTQRIVYEGRYPAMRANDMFGLYAIVHPADVDNACAEWMRGPAAEGETCTNGGPEIVNGRKTVKYELSCYNEICRLWIDRDLHAIVKRETKWNITELRNIREGPQPAGLFETPPGYIGQNVIGTIHQSEPQ